MTDINSNIQFKHAYSYYDKISAYLQSIAPDVNWTSVICRDWDDYKIYKYIYDILTRCIYDVSPYVNMIKLYNKLHILDHFITHHMTILNTTTRAHNTIISQIYKCNKLYRTHECNDIGTYIKSPILNYFDVVIVENVDVNQYKKYVKDGGILISISHSMEYDDDYLYHDIIHRINLHCITGYVHLDDNILPKLDVRNYIMNKDIRGDGLILLTDQIYDMQYISIFVKHNS